MRDLLALPATLLALIAASTINAQGHPRPADLLPEHQAHLKRERQAQEQLQWQQPVGMRKMSSDEGEKFFLYYWDFGESSAEPETLNEHIDGAGITPTLRRDCWHLWRLTLSERITSDDSLDIACSRETGVLALLEPRLVLRLIDRTAVAARRISA